MKIEVSEISIFPRVNPISLEVEMIHLVTVIPPVLGGSLNLVLFEDCLLDHLKKTMKRATRSRKDGTFTGLLGEQPITDLHASKISTFFEKEAPKTIIMAMSTPTFADLVAGQDSIRKALIKSKLPVN